jgi:hypothetical protein
MGSASRVPADAMTAQTIPAELARILLDRLAAIEAVAPIGPSFSAFEEH